MCDRIQCAANFGLTQIFRERIKRTHPLPYFLYREGFNFWPRLFSCQLRHRAEEPQNALGRFQKPFAHPNFKLMRAHYTRLSNLRSDENGSYCMGKTLGCNLRMKCNWLGKRNEF